MLSKLNVLIEYQQTRNEMIALDPKNFETFEKIQSSIMCVWLESGPGSDPTGQLDELTSVSFS